MPWKSVQQARWGHSPSGLKALGGARKVAEWDAATPKGSLPRRVKMASGGVVQPTRHGPRPTTPSKTAGLAGMPLSKGSHPGQAVFAAGGPVLGRSRDFFKPDGKVDEFTQARMPTKMAPAGMAKQVYTTKGAPSKRSGDKSEKAVVPRR